MDPYCGPSTLRGRRKTPHLSLHPHTYICLPSTHIHICVYPVYVNPQWGHQHCEGDARLPTRPFTHIHMYVYPVPTYIYVSTLLCESSMGPSTLRGRRKTPTRPCTHIQCMCLPSTHIHICVYPVNVNPQWDHRRCEDDRKSPHTSTHPHTYMCLPSIHIIPTNPYTHTYMCISNVYTCVPTLREAFTIAWATEGTPPPPHTPTCQHPKKTHACLPSVYISFQN